MGHTVRKLQVNVARGLADTEYYVMVPGGPAVYVTRTLVSVKEPPAGDREVKGQVEVFVIEEGPNDVLIELPGEAVVGGLRARVDKSLLLTA